MVLPYLAADYHQIEKTPGRKVCQEVKWISIFLDLFLRTANLNKRRGIARVALWLSSIRRNAPSE
ncbi:hypothetical protein DLM76_00885 [Leptospira yasudae]|uniref:Uncharacterized protein n=1 Tax=Leptospira yasudae TaxID=2202201 RepID=A0ABX9M2I9_9LEPT|nr:hypothetical protein DLM77_12175 [Leptospira yasudae]RHX95582.1 hypothetical protein DLM76_00885 [Leptospira yasudae]TGK27112.1 hypothetical protein EHQ05_09650 [Leptospira yasudae]TGM08095.1 hypothetical protein EHQ86_03520 [Leptospira yasudae]TGN02498.1 hypothetical protein EHR10_00795 [Leptospira yasudae]